MRRIRGGLRDSRVRTPAIAGVLFGAAVAAAGPVWLSGCRKKAEPELESLRPDFNAISDQIRNTRLESGVRKTGESWTKFRLVHVSSDYQLTRTASEKEPYHLQIAIKYRMEMMSKPATTAALAESADYDSNFDFPVMVTLVYQDGRWYLNQLVLRSSQFGPLGKPATEDLLAKSLRRML